MHAPEAALLLAAARPDGGRAGMRAVLAAGPDWGVLLQAALDHGVAALLCRLLLAEADLLPPEIAAAAESFLLQSHDDAMEAAHQLSVLVAALAAAGVPAVPFKGPALAQQAYGGTQWRRSRDLDLLIAEHDAAPALRVLSGLGYRAPPYGLRARHMQAYYRYNGQEILFAAGRLPVEPHWALAPRTLAAPLDTAGMLARAGALTLGGARMPALAIEDALLVTCFHGSKELWPRLIWIADVGGLLHRHPDLDAQAVLARATAAGVRRMLLLGIALAADLLAAPCPPPFAEAIAADPACRRMAEHMAARLLEGGGDAPSVFALSGTRLAMRERLSDRLRYVLRTLTTARRQHYQAIDLPDRLDFLYPLVRLGHDYLALPLWHAITRKRQDAAHD